MFYVIWYKLMKKQKYPQPIHAKITVDERKKKKERKGKNKAKKKNEFRK